MTAAVFLVGDVMRRLARSCLPCPPPSALSLLLSLGVLSALGARPARGQAPAGEGPPAAAAPASEPAAGRVNVTSRSAGLRAAIGRQGFITTWLVLGPFPYSQPPWGMDIDFLAEAYGGEAKAQAVKGAEVKLKSPQGNPPLDKVAWTPVLSDRAYVDLNTRMKPNDYVVAYAAAYLVSPRTQELFLKLGSDDGARAWLNGELIYDHPRPRDAIVDDDAVRIRVRAGANLLLLKIEERRGQWGFYCRILDDLRRPPPGLTVLLPGTGFGGLPALGAVLSTAVPREMGEGGVTLKPEVRAEVGYPLVGVPLYAKALVRPQSSRTPVVSSGVQGTSFGAMGRHKTEFRLPMKNLPDGEYVVRIEVGARGSVPFYLDDTRVVIRHSIYRDLGRARAALERISTPLRSGSAYESVLYNLEMLEGLVTDGDKDADYQEREARRVVKMAEELAAGRDPYKQERGAFYRAYRSPFDGRLQKYAVYVPKSYDPSRRYPLLIALHGLTGEVMMAIRVALGVDQRPDESYVRALRYLPPLPEVDYVIAAPYGYGDIAYRGIGTDDVLRVIDEMKGNYAIDEDRVILAGWSMGGIGVFEVGMRHADRFAALVALCGYADVGLYSSAYTRRRPFERELFEGERAVNYAENGRNVPLFIIHGTHDTPTNSLVFADRYTQLGYKLSVELPEAGHNVWGYAFEGGWLLKKLLGIRRVRMPSHVSLKAHGYRHRSLYWVSIEEIADLGRFARVEAQAVPGHENALEIQTENVERLLLSPGAPIVQPGRPVKVKIDGRQLHVADTRMALVKKGGIWSVDTRPGALGGSVKGRGERLPPVVAPSWGGFFDAARNAAGVPPPQPTPASASGGGAGAAGDGIPTKRPQVSGPILDTIYNRTLVVYGTQSSDGTEKDTLRRVAEELSRYRRGARIRLPLKADADVTAEDLQRFDLVLVGTPQQNLIVSRIADRLPVRIGKREITIGKRAYKGYSLGLAMVYPNPLQPNRTVTLYAATSQPALFDALHLPRLLPDYVIYDRRVTRDIGGFFLGKEREVLEAGFFDKKWHIPDRPYRGPVHWNGKLVEPLKTATPAGSTP